MAFDPPDTLPAALKDACKIGDLPLAVSFYTDLSTAEKTSRPTTLLEMAILASKNDHPALLSFCFSSGLEMKKPNCNDPLIYAACSSQSIAIHDVLIDQGGMDVNHWLELGGNPLMEAVYHGNIELTEHLLKRGADPNLDYALGEYNIMQWATLGDQGQTQHDSGESMLRLLIKYGAKVRGTGVLVAVAAHGNLRCVKVILELKGKDVDLEEIDEYGGDQTDKLNEVGTALFKAAQGGFVEIVGILLDHGADRGYKDLKGRSIVDVAREEGYGDVVRKLEGH